MIETTKKINAHFKIVIAAPPASGRFDPRHHETDDLTSRDGTGARRERSRSRIGTGLVCRQRLTGSVQRKNSALLNQVPGGNIRAIT